MESDVTAGATPERTTEAGGGRGAGGTRFLLGCGMVAGPFYLAVGLAQAFAREGFDLARHPLSLLANGPWGWIQTTNFALTGLMVVAAAVGFTRVLGVKARWTSRFLGGFGASMLVAAVFPADAVDGFPVGTPEGFPTSISTTGMVHFVAGALGFTALAVACFVGASAMSRHGVRSLARFSLVCGAVVFLGFFGGPAFAAVSAGTLGIWIGVVVGWVWLCVLSVHLYRGLAGPARPPRPG